MYFNAVRCNLPPHDTVSVYIPVRAQSAWWWPIYEVETSSQAINWSQSIDAHFVLRLFNDLLLMLYCNFSSTLKCRELRNTFNWKSTNCEIWGCCFACWRVWRSAKQRNLPENWDPPSRHCLLWIFSNSYWYERRRRWKIAVMSVCVWFPLGSVAHASFLKKKTPFLHNIAQHCSLWIIFIVLLMWIRWHDSSFARLLSPDVFVFVICAQLFWRCFRLWVGSLRNIVLPGLINN